MNLNFVIWLSLKVKTIDSANHLLILELSQMDGIHAIGTDIISVLLQDVNRMPCAVVLAQTHD